MNEVTVMEKALNGGIVTFAEYQQVAHLTAMYPLEGDRPLQYVTLGLTGEAGEIANKVKKIIRDSNMVITEWMKESIADEVGDVLWYIAELHGLLKMKIDPFWDMYFRPDLLDIPFNIDRLVTSVHSLCGIAAWAHENSFRVELITVLFANLSEIAHQCGMGIHECAGRNIVKLLNRKRCGMIQGQGDKR
jgi:NTP pyrophosphatase (non-canonical NTP hydrolase)